jgi:hypothetical protein
MRLAPCRRVCESCLPEHRHESCPGSAGKLMSYGFCLNWRCLSGESSRKPERTTCLLTHRRWLGKVHDNHVAYSVSLFAAAFQVAATDTTFCAPPDQPCNASKKHHQQQKDKCRRPTKQGGDHRVPEEWRAAKRHDQTARVDIPADYRLSDQERGQMPVRPELTKDDTWFAG